MTTQDSLRRAEARYQRASSASEAARLDRETAIREAAQTMTTRAIAAHVSVSHQRVAQIVKG